MFGGVCHEHAVAYQSLTAVGRKVAADPIPAAIPGVSPGTGPPQTLQSGTASGEALLVTFSPSGTPFFSVGGRCYTTLQGGYLPMNDSRWTTPGLGLVVRSPSSTSMTYDVTDPIRPPVGTSTWKITVERVGP